MQLLKQLWKQLRKVKPCVKCGWDHETKMCVTRRGRKNRKYEDDDD